MSLEEWMRTLLTEQPAHTAVLATVRADGRAHLKPIWFALDGDTIVFITGEHTVAGRNLSRDPRATLCVEVETPPYMFLTLEGDVRLTTHDEDPAGLRSWAGRLGVRYLGAEARAQTTSLNGAPGKYLAVLTIAHMTGAAGTQ